MAAAKTRRQRAANKAKRSPKATTVPVAPSQPAPLPAQQRPIPSVATLFSQTLRLLRHNRVTLSLVTLIYAILYGLLVQALSHIDVTALRDSASSRLSGGLGAYAQLVAGGSTSAASQTYQLLLFFVGSLAVIWVLRQTYDGGQASVRDSFYKGMYPLIPIILVSLVILVQCIPLLLGANGYELIIVNGIATNIIEQLLWALPALAFALLSLYFVAASLQAFYIVTLPDMTPLKALRSARQLVARRRWTILRKILALPLVIAIVVSIIMLPIIIVVPPAAPWVLVVLGAIVLTSSHTYLYTLYRSLLND